MKKIFPVTIIILCLLAGSGAGIWKARASLLENGLEFWLNRTQDVFFHGSLDLEGVSLGTDFRLGIQRVTGEWETGEGVFPFEVSAVRTEDPVYFFAMGRPVTLVFDGFRPQGSASPGIYGRALLFNDPEGTMELTARFRGLDLDELTALNPENLKGASGLLEGDFYLKANAREQQEFSLKLNVAPPGGRLQARFFDLLIPYLPPIEKERLAQVQAAGTVGYRQADFTAGLATPESVNLLLRIAIPDYNLNLNLNITVRVESHEAFIELATLFGLIQVKT